MSGGIPQRGTPEYDSRPDYYAARWEISADPIAFREFFTGWRHELARS